MGGKQRNKVASKAGFRAKNNAYAYRNVQQKYHSKEGKFEL